MIILKYSQKITFCAILHICFCVALEANTSALEAIASIFEANTSTLEANTSTLEANTSTLEAYTSTLEANAPAFEFNTPISGVETKTILITEAPDLSDEDQEETWLENALRDIAYYLRNYRFNDWDRRYYTYRPNDPNVGFYDAFPSPSLKSIHFEVQKYCHKDLFRCISYLHKVIKKAPFTRSDDIVTTLNKNSITINIASLRSQNNNCKRALLYADRTGLPFDGPLEKFTWRTSASYFMCWYTMKGHPALSMLGEACDNYANCLDGTYGNRNHDPRSNDMSAFACAMYSFCPDACCPLKHVSSLSECFKDGIDPCYNENTKINAQCSFDRNFNQHFDEIVENKWNVTCNCRKTGFKWDSKFGMCVDLNECKTFQHNCDMTTEDCLNEQGSYRCVCKWGFVYDEKLQECIAVTKSDLQQFNDFKNNRNIFDDVDMDLFM